MAPEPPPSDKLSIETTRATEDVRLLLEFLGRRADNLLQAQFEDTRAELGASVRRLAIPPCRTYKHFLNRLTFLETGFDEPRPTRDTPSPTQGSPAEGDEDLSDLAFLYLSRDFLAAVAAPATIDSIRITNAYVRGARPRARERSCARLDRTGGAAKASTGPGATSEERELKMTADDRFDLQRFITAQEPVFETVLAELRAGRKRSHWMWFVFPQLAGLGRSSTARFYGIGSVDEARAYLAHPVLARRLDLCTRIVLASDNSSLHAIFGSPDDLKFRSCMTLFSRAADDADNPFRQALDRWCDGRPDEQTLALIG
jgi:uncharacterized protein (DUF1810 family)